LSDAAAGTTGAGVPAAFAGAFAGGVAVGGAAGAGSVCADAAAAASDTVSKPVETSAMNRWSLNGSTDKFRMQPLRSKFRVRTVTERNGERQIARRQKIVYIHRMQHKPDVEKKAAKANRIRAILAELYPTTPIPLQHKDPFTLLVAVLLSAQCTDRRVNLVTPSLFALADTPQKMAQQTVAAIQEIIRPCGLSPQKAKAIQRLSEILCEKYAGAVPANMAQLEELPGVGHKTASVVVSQAYGQAAFPVDTHIHRLAQRWGLSSGRNVVETERDLKAIFPENTWNLLHLQIIYFGREYCPARGHDVATCPICSWAAQI